MRIKDTIQNRTLPLMRKRGRTLETLLIEHLFDQKESLVLSELSKYQNVDGGFGYGLEGDLRSENSSVLCTCMAMDVLNDLDDEELKEDMIQKIVNYLEQTYLPIQKGWSYINHNTNDAPRAIWWNYDESKSIDIANPGPEVIGFLFQYKEYVEDLDIDALLNDIIEYSNELVQSDVEDHQVYSYIKLYNRLDETLQKKLYDNILTMVDDRFSKTKNTFDTYEMYPFSIATLNPIFLKNQETLLEKDLKHHLNILEDNLIEPLWTWYQFDEVFEEFKDEWSSRLTYEFVRGLRKLGKL